MKKVIIVLAALAITAVLGYLIFRAYEKSTPEYALRETIQDCREEGVEGLKKHLTENALEIFETAESKATALEGNPLAVMLKEKAIKLIKEKLSEVEWEIEDILKGKGRRDYVMSFDYQGKIAGTVNVVMVKQGMQWKIDGLSALKLEKLDLLRENEE